MRKIKKVFNFGIIAIVFSAFFLFNASVYSSQSENTLRVPVGQKSTYGRLNEEMEEGVAGSLLTDPAEIMERLLAIFSPIDGSLDNAKRSQLAKLEESIPKDEATQEALYELYKARYGDTISHLRRYIDDLYFAGAEVGAYRILFQSI